jgi:hypothetical protein
LGGGGCTINRGFFECSKTVSLKVEDLKGRVVEKTLGEVRAGLARELTVVQGEMSKSL